MLNNRVSTAQIAEELLDDFYVRNNHEMLRRKHNRKLQQKLVQPLGGLTPIQTMHLSKSLENFDRIDGTFSSQLRGSRGGKGGALSKSVTFGKREYQDGMTLTLSDTASSTSTSTGAATTGRDVKYKPSQGIAGDNQKGNKRGASNPMAVDMMHRVTFQAGGSPGKFHQLHTSSGESEALSSTSSVTNTQEEQEEMDNATIAANAREIQYNAMNESVIMQQILTEILDLHKDVEKCRSELETELPIHRQDLLTHLDVANVTYVRLFERMLAETLLIQRSKFKNQTATIRELRAQLGQLQIAEQGSREKEVAARNAAQQMEIETATLHKMIEQLQLQLSDVQLKYAALEDENKTNLRKIEALKGGLSLAEKSAFANEIRNEERAKFMKEIALLKKKWEKEMEARAKELAKEHRAPAGPTMADLTAAAKQNNDFKRPMADMTTQTEVDEHGIWDKQDGWFLPVSGTRLARLRWRAALNFTSCPQCRGAGHFIGLAAKLLRMMMRGGGNALVDEDKKPKGKTGARWLIPDDLVRFLSNIPRSALAISPKPLVWTLRRIWHHLDKKCKSDDTDEAQGLPIQELQDFLVEAYLIRSEKRSDAELALFILLQSMQEHHKRNPLIHTYSRFVGVLDGWTVEQMKIKHAEREELQRKQEQRDLDAKFKKMSSRERTAYARKLEDEKRERLEREHGKAQEEEKLPLCDASLSLSIMTVYLYARSCLFEPYTGIFVRKIKEIKDSSTHLTGNEDKLRGKEDERKAWPINLPSHACVDRAFAVYMPLDRALRVLTCIISFADEKQYNSALRLLEHSVVLLLPDGEIRLPEGMHTSIRSCVRELLSTDSADGADLTNLEVYLRQQQLGKIPPRDPDHGPATEKELEDSRDVMLVNMDVVLRIVCECLLYRTRYVEKRLAEIFVEGDENKDGVLSFGEFMTIVHNVAPHFTDRRALRMYREALSMGNDDDSIGPEAFVAICKKHGLVSLINLREIRQGSLKALSKTEEQKAQEQKNREIALAAKAAAMLSTPAPLFAKGFKSPQDRAMARRNSTLQIMSRKGISHGLMAVAAAQGVAGESVLTEAHQSNSPGKPFRRGSVMSKSVSPARDLLASLKKATQTSQSNINNLENNDNDGSQVGFRTSPTNSNMPSPVTNSPACSAQGALTKSTTASVVDTAQASVENMPLAAVALGSGSGINTLASPIRSPTEGKQDLNVSPGSATEHPQSPAPAAVSFLPGSSRMFGSPTCEQSTYTLLEEEQAMSDSDSSSGSGNLGMNSDDSNEFRGVIARKNNPQGQRAVEGESNRIIVPDPDSAPMPALPGLAPSHATQSRDNLLATFRREEDEKMKSLQDSAVGNNGAAVAAALRKRAQARLES